METDTSAMIRKQYGISKNPRFASQPLFTKVPLHFQFFAEPAIVIDHTGRSNSDQTSKKKTGLTNKMKRGERKTKIFQKRSACEATDKSTSESSRSRIRKSTIFKNSNVVLVRDLNSINIQDSMKQLVNCSRCENQPKGELQKQNKKEERKRAFFQESVLTPDELRLMKGKIAKNCKISSQPLHPSQFQNLMKKIARSRCSKKPVVPYFLPQSQGSFAPCLSKQIPNIQHGNRQNIVLRI